MREKNLLRRRHCKDVVIVSQLFFKAREGEGGTKREERRDSRRGQEKKWETVRTSS